MAKASSKPRRTSGPSRDSSRRVSEAPSPPSVRPAPALRLYVSLGAPNSMRAIANLDAICQSHFEADGGIEIVDVFRDPERAQADAVSLTPMLVKVASGRTLRILGTLDDTQAVLAALGLKDP